MELQGKVVVITGADNGSTKQNQSGLCSQSHIQANGFSAQIAVKAKSGRHKSHPLFVFLKPISF